MGKSLSMLALVAWSVDRNSDKANYAVKDSTSIPQNDESVGGNRTTLIVSPKSSMYQNLSF